jgi:hypothetical protein
MSDALVCDNCGAVLKFDAANGREDAKGEKAGWLNINVGEMTSWDACTRSCATQILADGGPIQEVADAWSEAVADVARTIREADEGGSE